MTNPRAQQLPWLPAWTPRAPPRPLRLPGPGAEPRLGDVYYFRFCPREWPSGTKPGRSTRDRGSVHRRRALYAPLRAATRRPEESPATDGDREGKAEGSGGGNAQGSASHRAQSPRGRLVTSAPRRWRPPRRRSGPRSAPNPSPRPATSPSELVLVLKYLESQTLTKSDP